MGKITHYKRAKTTAIRNDMLQSSLLSLKAKGLLAMMLSFPDGWEYRREHLVSLSTDGRESWQSGIKELITRGYVARHRSREQGRWEYNYLVSDEPLSIQAAERFHMTGQL